MSAFLYGVLGVLGVLVLLGGGFWAGWKAREALTEKTQKTAAKELGEAERKRLVDEQRAFSTLVNYNAETAYGLNAGLDELTKGNKEE